MNFVLISFFGYFLILTTTTMALVIPSEIPKYTMNDGRKIPAIGIGTFLGFDQNGFVTPKNKELRNAVEAAIDKGYRHIDTAAIYETEEEVGEAIRRKIDQGVIRREDVFVTTKLWNTAHRKAEVLAAANESLKKLNLDYIDLYLIHWPIGLNKDNTQSDTDFMEAWFALEDLQKSGKIKSIGLSNFNRTQIERIFLEGHVKPAVLQIEIHPALNQKELVNYAQSKGLVVTAYSPLGSLVKRFGLQMPGPEIDDSILVDIAKKYEKTTAQIVLAWLVNRQIIPIPKTLNPNRMAENIDIFDIKLTEDEISKIDSFNINARYTLPSFWQNHPFYPFEKIDNPIDDPFVKQ